MFKPFLIKGNKLMINNDATIIDARNFEILISQNNSKILLLDGSINSFPFNKIKAYIDLTDNKLLYESSHSLSSEKLSDINSIDLSSLKDHEIYLDFDTKGFLDFKSSENSRFDRLTFKNSSITTNLDFLIKDINLIAYLDLNNE